MAFNFGQGLSGGASGALSGAGIGAFGGPIGAGIGAGVGGLLGLLGGGLSESNKPKQGALSLYSPQVQSQFDPLLMNILGKFQSGELGGNFEPIANKARQNFQSKTLPSIMERLTALGGGGGRSNASFNVPAQAGADLEASLAAQGSQYGLDQQRLLLSLLGLGQGSPFYQQAGPNQFEKLMSGLNSGVGSLLGSYLGAGGTFGQNKEIAPLVNKVGVS